MSEYIICEYGFKREDPKHLGYSFKEVDCYAWIPTSAQKRYGVVNHRLTIWKNLKTNEFELIAMPVRESFRALVLPGNIGGAVMITNEETGEKHKVVIAHKDLAVICQEASALQEKYHGYKMTYKVCQHTTRDYFCEKQLEERMRREKK